MTNPAPSISRLFAAAFLAIAVAGLADRVATWRSAPTLAGGCSAW